MRRNACRTYRDLLSKDARHEPVNSNTLWIAPGAGSLGEGPIPVRSTGKGGTVKRQAVPDAEQQRYRQRTARPDVFDGARCQSKVRPGDEGCPAEMMSLVATCRATLPLYCGAPGSRRGRRSRWYPRYAGVPGASGRRWSWACWLSGYPHPQSLCRSGSP